MPVLIIEENIVGSNNHSINVINYHCPSLIKSYSNQNIIVNPLPQAQSESTYSCRFQMDDRVKKGHLLTNNSRRLFTRPRTKQLKQLSYQDTL